MPAPMFFDPTLTYLYVDGESHFLMSEQCIKGIFGSEVTLDTLTTVNSGDQRKVFAHPPAKFFCDWHFLSLVNLSPDHVQRAVYFTAFCGHPSDLFQAQVNIRKAGFEPQVLPELKDLAKQRENRRKSDSLIIKPKGVDVALAVRMLDDAYNNNYKQCIVATSDIDYLPAIQAVRRMGKRVVVLGHSTGMASDSPFHYAVDYFIELASELKRWYRFRGVAGTDVGLPCNQ